MRPIVLIPGVGASKLVAVDRSSGAQQYGWINSSFIPFSTVSKASEFLWGENDAKGTYKSYVDQYYSVEAISGIKGCDKLIDWDILDTKIFENVDFAKYFGPLIKYLETQFGYEREVTLFAYSYDWRQCLHEEKVQSGLFELLKSVTEKHGKPILIGHSLGGVLTETFMRLRTNWADYIHHFIALCVPFDGASAYTLQAPILGYNLRLPIPNVVAKGMQAKCGCTQYLAPSPQQRQGIVSQVYVKISKDMKRNVINNDNSLGSNTICLGGTTHIDTHEDSDEDDQFEVTLNDKVYEGKIPDMMYILAERIINENYIQSMSFNEKMRTFQIIKESCKSGAVQMKTPFIGLKNLVKQTVKQTVNELTYSSPPYLLEKDFETNLPTLNDLKNLDYEWEVFDAWRGGSDFKLQHEFERFYLYESSQFVTCSRKDNAVKLTQEFYDAKTELEEEEIIRQSYFKPLLKFAQAMSYERELNQDTCPFPQEIREDSRVVKLVRLIDQASQFLKQSSFQKANQETLTELDEMRQHMPKAPWSSPMGRLNCVNRSLYELCQLIHPNGTLDGFLYRPDPYIYLSTQDVRLTPIDFENAGEFRFTSICGGKVETPLHAVYVNPVFEYPEILNQKPEYIFADGDGTVLLTSSLGDEFPDNLVNDRVVLQGTSHFGIMCAKLMHDEVGSVIKIFGYLDEVSK